MVRQEMGKAQAAEADHKLLKFDDLIIDQTRSEVTLSG
jgi:hypothetical protein